jgi:DNA-binding transcriptional MerR regulator
MKIKKYYTIGEVAQKLNIPENKIRSMDSLFGDKLLRIRGRRYYSRENMQLIKHDPVLEMNEVESLINTFRILKSRLESLLK